MTKKSLAREIAELRRRLEESEDMLQAIRSGQVDALVIAGAAGERLFVLEGAEQPYRIFLETMSEGAATLRADGTILYSNQTFAKILKTPLEHVIGSTLEGFLDATQTHRLRALLEQAMTGDAKGDFSFIGAEGSHIQVALSFTPTGRKEAAEICLIATDITERKRAYYETRSHLAAIVDSTDDAIISSDLEGLILTWNSGAEKLYGYSAEEIVGKPSSILRPARFAQETEKINQQIARGEKIERQVVTHVCKDGHQIQIDLTVSPLRNEAGTVTGSAAICRDITERIRNETDLQHLAAIVQSTDDAIISEDLDGVVISWNRAAEAMFGYSAHEAIGRCMSLVAAPSLPDQMPSLLVKIRRGETITDFETVRRCKDGREIEISLTVSPIRDATGRITGASKIARDISARLRVEATLERQNARLRQQAQLIDLSHDAIITMAPDGLITGWNAGATEMFGWSEEEVVGKLNRSVLATSPSLDPAIKGDSHSQNRWDGELVRTKRDGQRQFIESRQVFLKNEAGLPMGTLEIDRDITLRKLNEEGLQRSYDEKVSMLREIHHRVKNNLQIISSLLSMQANSVDQATAAKLADSGRRVRSMAMIHQQLYQHESSMSSIDLAEYLHELAANLFSSYSPDSLVACRLEVSPVQLTIEQAIPCGLILNELITNALKYAYPCGGGEIVIRLWSQGALVCMTVADQGVGLPPGFDWETSESLGMKLVDVLARQLDGRLEIGGPPGASFTVRFTKLVEHQNASSAFA